MTVAKDKKIAELQSKLDEKGDDIVEARRSINELQAELDACSGMNDRLNRTMKKEREKSDTLKGVARFFRAQRDRIDANLSGTLDGVERDRNRPKTECYDSPVRLTETATEGPRDRRPAVQEPSAYPGDEGRNFTPYRDSEPHTDWESL